MILAVIEQEGEKTKAINKEGKEWPTRKKEKNGVGKSTRNSWETPLQQGGRNKRPNSEPDVICKGRQQLTNSRSRWWPLNEWDGKEKKKEKKKARLQTQLILIIKKKEATVSFSELQHDPKKR